MSIKEFIKNIEEEFEDLTPGTIKGTSVFRLLDGWSSMMALIIIAKIDTVYNITITAEELSECKTLADLFNITAAKAK